MNKKIHCDASITPNTSNYEDIDKQLDYILDYVDNINKYRLNKKIKFSISEIEDAVYNIKNILNK